MRDTPKTPTGGIVAQFRLAVLATLLSLATAVTLGAWQFSRVLDSQAHLSAVSVPFLTQSQDIDHSLTTMALSVFQLGHTNTIEELEITAAALDARYLEVRKAAETLLSVASDTNDPTTLTNQLNDFDATIQITVATKTDLFTSTAAIQNLRTQLGRIHQQIHQDLTALFATMPASQPGPDTSQGPIGPAPNLSDFRAATDRYFELARQIGPQTSPEQITRTLSALALPQQDWRRKFAALPNVPQRKSIANHITASLDMLSPQGRLLQEVTAVHAAQVALAHQFEKQFNLISEISTLTGRLQQRAHDEMIGAIADHRTTTKLSIYITSITAICAAIGILLLNHLITERKIGRRLSMITEAALKIAQGNTQHPIEISGNDELGRIASALETFKVTANELHRSNTELEKFAYAAAHDLRAPLRAIQGLVRWTIDDPDTVLSASSQRNLNMLLTRADRLSALLSDLLTYAQVGHEHDDITSIDISDLVDTTHDLLDPNGHFSVQFDGPIGTTTTYSTPLHHILLNALSNAIKHHDADTGSIAVSTSRADGRLTVTVSDDGPGIPLNHQDQAFDLFKTLRPRDQVEGSGLGLSIIQKYAAHYDGRVTLRSDPEVERGTHLTFDLPDFSLAQATAA